MSPSKTKRTAAQVSQTTLAQSIPFFKVVAELADLAPIPGVKTAAGAVVALLELVEGRYQNSEDLKELVSHATRLVYTLNGWSTKDSSLNKVIEQINSTLNEILESAKQMGKASWFRKLFGARLEAADIVDFRRKLAETMTEFQLAAQLHVLDGVTQIIKAIALSESPSLVEKYVLASASYDTKDLDNAIECLDKTRREILADMHNWVMVILSKYQLFWLYAPAGGGKTAIMRTLCKLFQQQGIPFESFFLFRASNRTSLSLFVTTLAYQLALYSPQAGLVFQKTIKDSTIFGRSLKTQFQRLFLPTLEAVLSAMPESLPFVFVIDGFDECDDLPEREQVLTIIKEALPKLNTRVKFIIASRQEEDIQRAIETFDHRQVSQYFIKPNEEDIRTILSTGFDSIHQIPRLKGHLDNWPSTAQYEQLVINSSGYPVYAAVAMAHIETGPGGPKKALKDVLACSSTTGVHPLQRLYSLYGQVLETARSKPLLSRIIHLLVVHASSVLTTQTATEFLSSPGETISTLEIEDALLDVRSLISISPAGDLHPPIHNITFPHKSFLDFILALEPGQDFAIDLAATQLQVLERGIELLKDKDHLIHTRNRAVDDEGELQWADHSERALLNHLVMYLGKQIQPPPISLLQQFRIDLDVTYQFPSISGSQWGLRRLYIQQMIDHFEDCPEVVAHFEALKLDFWRRTCLRQYEPEASVEGILEFVYGWMGDKEGPPEDFDPLAVLIEAESSGD